VGVLVKRALRRALAMARRLGLNESSNGTCPASPISPWRDRRGKGHTMKRNYLTGKLHIGVDLLSSRSPTGKPVVQTSNTRLR